MKNSKTTRKALFASALSLVLTTSMMIGTTWAWFTDSATSSNNKIQSGTLNIDLKVKNSDGDYVSVKNSNDPIFNYDKWEPGYTYATNVKVDTTGNLALKYSLKFASTADIASEKLAEVIDVYYAPSQVNVATRQTDYTTLGLRKLGTLKDVFEGGAQYEINDTLIPGSNTEDFATIVLKMQESAGNEYQGLSISSFDMKVLATQYTYEEDSFNNQYDAGATFPVATVAEFNNALSNASDGDTVSIIAGDYTIPSTGVPVGVTIAGSSTGTTTLDTASISGSNTGTLTNNTFKDIAFETTTDYANPPQNGPSWTGIISHKTTLNNTTFENCTFDAGASGRNNAIYGGTANGNITFEGCTISADVYGVNFSYVNGTLTFKNCDITGWNSFGGGQNGADSKVVFENCRFHKSGSYGTLRFYQDAEVKNCTFDDDFQWIDCNASNKTINIINCTGVDGKIHNNGSHTNTWIVDGTDISSTVRSH